MGLTGHLSAEKQRGFIGRRPTYLAIAVAFLIGALIAGLLGFGGYQITERAKYLLVLVLFAIVGIYFALNWSLSAKQEGLDLFELPVWYTLSALLHLGVGGGIAFVNPRWFDSEYLPDRHWIVVALSINLIGIISLWIGYRVPEIIELSDRQEGPSEVGESVSGEKLALVYAVILGIRTFRVLAIGITRGLEAGLPSWAMPINQWINYLDQAGYLIVALAALEVFRKRWPSLWLYVILGIEAFFILITGFKKQLLHVMLVIVGAHLYARKEIPRRLIIMLAILGIIVVPVSEFYRDIFEHTVDPRSVVSAASGIGQAFAGTWLSSVSRSGELLSKKLQGRWSSLVQHDAAIIYLTPSKIP